MIPEESEDMWHVYNLIQEGDLLRSSTIRLFYLFTQFSLGLTIGQLSKF